MDVARYEIRRDILQRWDEMDITLLFGINFGRMRTRWIENSCTSQWSNVSVHILFWKLKEKIRVDEAAIGQRGIEGGDDDVNQ